MILLDTDVMVDILRGFEKAVRWLEAIEEQETGLPGLVAMELIQGCKNAKDQRLLEEAFAAYQLYWPDWDD
jgi:tRNA(fMet)-specific endonuclease VapC